MTSRILSLFIFIVVILAYAIAPAYVSINYMSPESKRSLMREAREWARQKRVYKQMYATQSRPIIDDTSLSKEEKSEKLAELRQKLQQKQFNPEDGKRFHKRLITMGVTPDIPVLIGIYFIIGIFLFWLYRRWAKKADFTMKIQYTFYLFIISVFIIITTFGFGYTATYLSNTDYWSIQSQHLKIPLEQVQTPIEETPFIVFHFIIFALNAAAMGPFDYYMTVRPNSLTVSLMQWLERLFVISVLFSSIARLWLAGSPASGSEENHRDDTII